MMRNEQDPIPSKGTRHPRKQATISACIQYDDKVKECIQYDDKARECIQYDDKAKECCLCW